MEYVDALRDPWILAYLGLILFGQWALNRQQRAADRARAARRERAGLHGEALADPVKQLGWYRSWAIRRLLALLLIGILFPIVILTGSTLGNIGDTNGLFIAFIGFIVFLLWGATDVVSSWFVGLAFESLVAARCPFQVGDRVTIKGHSGKVISIDPWFVKLQTMDDDLVSIPTASLWGETLVSANAGDRSSLVVVEVRLASEVDQEGRRKAESFLLDAIQSSAYLDPSKPTQLLIEQTGGAIVLRGKAYVGSTYNEPLMRTDVVRAFLDYAADEDIALARR